MTALLVGTINNDTLTGRLQGKKVKIEFTTTQKTVFPDIQKQAKQELFHSGDYARGSKKITRYNHAFSDQPEMRTGCLWFILTECISKERKLNFYELTLRTYSED